MDNLTELESNVLKAKQEEGLTVIEILNKFHITRFNYNKMIGKFKDLGLYDEKACAYAKLKRQQKLREPLNLSKEEESFRKKCIDFLAINYFDYNKTKKFNPLLVKRLQTLSILSSYEVIYFTMQEVKPNIDYAMQSKKFENENQKISYILAIIRNNLDTYNIILTNQKSKNEKSNILNEQDKYNLENLNKSSNNVHIEKFDFSIFD